MVTGTQINVKSRIEASKLISTARSCYELRYGHGQKYAIFESADDCDDKKEPTDGAEKTNKKINFQLGPATNTGQQLTLSVQNVLVIKF